ncbi:ADP-ribosylglycohydrolase family protein [Plantactinospora sp. KLBMP9567]|uniref:ADP-ribosylglycohydrolase family protein n=1 Tax=Plantactinospora sp. KLBMP9567 TaxID=3085900 RepID=UPI0029820AE2|nr:ADP-ribosylglycohydrolase family protein [Plantactinospora sp. KLBMP9567]MDW5328283.1 ADP-ribosylglycohydrolase family protein [Plantactinospora sp. KLBMP9567]
MTHHDHSTGRARLRIRGCLLAAASGHALGSAFHGAGPVDGGTFDNVARSEDPLPCTDATARMLLYARWLSVMRDRRLDSADLVSHLHRTWATSVGEEHPPRLRELLDAGGQRQDGGDVAEGTTVCAVIPVGLSPLPLPRIAARARLVAAVGEADPRTQEAAVGLACAVALVHQSGTARPLDRNRFVHQLAHLTADGTFGERLSQAGAVGHRPAGDVRVRLDLDGTAQSRVLAALAAFLRHPDNPAAAIRDAATLTGPAAEVAAMAGALTATRTGGTAIPAPWLRRLRYRELICDVGDELAAATGSAVPLPSSLA